MKLKDLRDEIGIVQQDVYLFAGTIIDNIRYGRPDATDEEVIRAAKAANAHEFIMELADGYDTDIGQRGVKLSGGQKQRLSIARVFLKPADPDFRRGNLSARQRKRKSRPEIFGTSGERQDNLRDCAPAVHNPECKADSGADGEWNCGGRHT